ncbi:ABC transporter ATP-binding protein [Pseudobacteriovorax antillogorgiicola]|uniref:Amino acid/amide ABC transporter ATP-binding protein 2, HAAT family n=1 Tax=Pseudobacteriovorax antillogorgiicola TaxID=1513793 RepID=A0A1Y6CPH4_9BACT|nr:ABC transporter ATP-binding protein [Pseudobacteriovorax antillogorgiicola]TCS44416.1 amino acid/amide ABC transporter ATP-binding protein 2 (HAAT family) [Pseudobacteriovorax antillogorgiicola]SMF79120.1 amino acid/amide ABC transporter ATP-binding protein 2, HAAT family [Pseudobacteriovorax antillogorgiicola]
MDQGVLTIDHINASYGPIQALHGVSLTIKEGEIVSLIGSNGAGKSTLLMSIFGNPRAQGGKVRLFGEDITSLPTHQIAKKGIALVPEGRHIFPKMTVEENLKMGTIVNQGKYEAEGLAHVYETFPRLKERKDQRAGTLSGGEQQMLAIGRALMSRPKILLLDEPSLGLAPIIVKDIFRILKEISATGTTIFLVEQNASQALKIAHRGYVLVNGKVKLKGNSADLLNDPQVKEAYLG